MLKVSLNSRDGFLVPVSREKRAWAIPMGPHTESLKAFPAHTHTAPAHRACSAPGVSQGDHVQAHTHCVFYGKGNNLLPVALLVRWQSWEFLASGTSVCSLLMSVVTSNWKL